VVGSIALFLGVLTGCAALSLIPIVRGAIGLVHLPMALFLSHPHGGWEFSAFCAIARRVQARRGAGAFTRPVRSAGVVAVPARAVRPLGERAKTVDVASFGRRLERCRHR